MALIVPAGLLCVAVIGAIILFAPLTKTEKVGVVVEGDYEPVVYQGVVKRERVYFLIDRRGQDAAIVLRWGIGISVPSGRMWSVLGLYLWERNRSFGVPITSPKMEAPSGIMWEDRTVHFDYHGSRFHVSLP